MNVNCSKTIISRSISTVGKLVGDASLANETKGQSIGGLQGKCTFKGQKTGTCASLILEVVNDIMLKATVVILPA